uniref:Uncharacterized protein n=1 Tax=Octopus bimaculoides TaxID=37653 RepID=A0A0L8IHK2_OCTBM
MLGVIEWIIYFSQHVASKKSLSLSFLWGLMGSGNPNTTTQPFSSCLITISSASPLKYLHLSPPLFKFFWDSHS